MSDEQFSTFNCLHFSYCYFYYTAPSSRNCSILIFQPVLETACYVLQIIPLLWKDLTHLTRLKRLQRRCSSVVSTKLCESGEWPRGGRENLTCLLTDCPASNFYKLKSSFQKINDDISMCFLNFFILKSPKQITYK